MKNSVYAAMYQTTVVRSSTRSVFRGVSGIQPPEIVGKLLDVIRSRPLLIQYESEHQGRFYGGGGVTPPECQHTI